MDLDEFLFDIPRRAQQNNVSTQGACVGTQMEQNEQRSAIRLTTAIQRIRNELENENEIPRNTAFEIVELQDENDLITRMTATCEEKSRNLKSENTRLNEIIDFYKGLIKEAKLEGSKLTSKLLDIDRQKNLFNTFKAEISAKLETKDTDAVSECLDKYKKEVARLQEEWINCNNSITKDISDCNQPDFDYIIPY